MELEAGLLRYFCDIHFPVLLLPGVSDDFLVECRDRYLDFALRSDGVKDSIIACCASNKYALTGDSRFAHLSMQYYGKAVKHVNFTITEIDLQGRKPDECLLAAVVFLYFDKLWGPNHATHASAHVAGAIQIFKLCHWKASTPDLPTRLPQSPMKTAIDRLMAESILYQALMLYLRNPFSPTSKLDVQFLSWMESALQPLWDDAAVTKQRSAILGLPLALYHLILDIIELQRKQQPSRDAHLARVQDEMQTWETFALTSCSQVPSDQNDQLIILFILASSLLLDWIVELSSNDPTDNLTVNPLGSVTPDVWLRGQPKSRWQTLKALSILRFGLAQQAWTLCFLGAWPLLMVGYAVYADDEIDTVVEVLRRMWIQTGYGEIKRIYEELTKLWGQRTKTSFERWGTNMD
ncbi:hypothetical protein E8E14_010241 [Neopestalotiopsis sp. 37M]|nr:hypothetical protein E8E14_010241 [Neopestalotiopsis sp. 37M]